MRVFIPATLSLRNHVVFIPAGNHQHMFLTYRTNLSFINQYYANFRPNNQQHFRIRPNMFSRACEYAIQALIDLAERPVGVHVPVKEIAGHCNVPYHFLGKIVQQLSKNGVLSSAKGPRGGITLAAPPGEITLLRIVEAIDGLDVATRCVLGHPSCHDKSPCPLHVEWGKNREQIMKMLTERSLEDLAAEYRANKAVV
jgi:Rrf2 family transcriptional regulator, iron-sulfur cluster assembly transcription factor